MQKKKYWQETGKSILLTGQYLSYLSTEECYDYASLGE